MAERDPGSIDAQGEHDSWAEHRAALESTLFGVTEPPIVFELRDGELHRR